jgi:hypothetical protein
MNTFDEYLYIDYENVQDVKIEVLKKNVKVMIIVGNTQTKVPIELIMKTQPFGNAVEWVQVSANGRNALDFFIAYFLGRDTAADQSKSFIIYSKDAGYDPLIAHLKQKGMKAKRIVSFQELNQHKLIVMDEAGIKKVKDSLRKVASNSRPKKKASLVGFINATLTGMPKPEIENIIENMFIKKIFYEENGLIKYALDK